LIALIWIVFGYFGVFDLGLSRALAYRLAALRNESLSLRASVFHTACSLNLILGLTSGLAFYLLANILAQHLTADSAMHGEVMRAIPWVALFFPVGLLGGSFAGCLQAEERFLSLNVQQSVGAVLFQCLPLLLVLTINNDLDLAILGAVLARFISVVWMGVECLRWARAAGPPALRLSHARMLFGYGGWVTVSDMIGPILNGLDQMIIGGLLGAKATAHYSVPFSASSKSLIVPSALCRAVFPRLSSVSPETARRMTRQLVAFVAGAMALLCVPAIMLTHVGLQLWIGEDFADAAYVAASILLVGMWFNSIALLPFTFLQAQGRPDLIAKIHAFELLPFVALLLILIKLLGLEGAALAWCIRMLLDAVLQSWQARLRWSDWKPAVAPGAAVLCALGMSLLDLNILANACGMAAISAVLLLWMVLFTDIAQHMHLRAWIARARS